jgi:AraC-like DNA-binding protein
MDLNLNLINLLILFGAFHGLVFGIILLFNKKHPGARFLSAFMFVLAYNGFETFSWSSKFEHYYVLMDVFPFILIFALGPSLYLYVSSLLYPERKFSGKMITAHYAIVAFQFCFRTLNIAYHILWSSHIFRGQITSLQMELFYWAYSEPVSVLVFLIYLGASLHMFRKAKADGSLGSVSKEGRQVILKWVRALLACMVVLGISWPLTVLTPLVFDIETSAYYYPIELALVLFIYWVAYVGYYRTKTIYPRSLQNSSSPVTVPDAARILEQLRGFMQNDKLYLNPELNLQKLAVQTGIGAKTISLVLNQYAHQSFHDFVNEYRVQEVKSRLMDTEFQHLTISGIALEAGFNSQATFQRVFKNVTGRTPREYIAFELKKTAKTQEQE